MTSSGVMTWLRSSGAASASVLPAPSAVSFPVRPPNPSSARTDPNPVVPDPGRPSRPAGCPPASAADPALQAQNDSGSTGHQEQEKGSYCQKKLGRSVIGPIFFEGGETAV